ncbi:hypothetical protein ACP4OV_028555 [Aristida adscensionis]
MRGKSQEPPARKFTDRQLSYSHLPGRRAPTMAVGFVNAAVGDGRRYDGRITVFVALSCVTAALGASIFGYDLGSSGGVSSMEPFLREFFPEVYRRMKGDVRVSNYCKFDSQLLTLFTSSLYISGLLTAMLLSSWFTARRGRRPSMIVGGVAFIAGAVVSGAAVDVYMAILGRALLGVGLGFANQAQRFQLTLCLGSLAANIINFGAEKIKGGWGWRLSLGLAGVPAVFFTLGAIFLPETPNSLVQQGEDREKPFTQLNGINAIGFYAPVLLRTVGMGESASLLSTVVTVVIYTASTVVFMFVIDRFGRRTLLIAGSLQMLVSEVLIGAIMAAKLGDEGGMSRGYAAALFVLIGVYVAGYSWSWGPMTWLVSTEVLPLEIRSAGQSVTVASGFVFTIFVAQGFIDMLCRMREWLFFFFPGWIVVMTAFVYLFLPETKGLPIEQIGKVWGEHWFWKWVVGTDALRSSDKL